MIKLYPIREFPFTDRTGKGEDLPREIPGRIVLGPEKVPREEPVGTTVIKGGEI